jgi:nitroimidazol reductase NimA-like FMN-containing flavoprotein (pyridoxamine 5'-phosphate oxidase superfamily)
MAKYHMQKSEREITDANVIEQILKQGNFLTLALCRNNEPYVLTLNYGYDQQDICLYFHTAKQGLKLDFITDNPRACGTVVEDHGYLHGRCSHAYRSVVFSGNIYILESLTEKQLGLDIMLQHLEKEPDTVKQRLLNTVESYDSVTIMRLKIDEISGKEGNI